MLIGPRLSEKPVQVPAVNTIFHHRDSRNLTNSGVRMSRHSCLFLVHPASPLYLNGMQVRNTAERSFCLKHQKKKKNSPTVLFGSLKRGTKGNQKQQVCEEITAAAGSDRDTSTGAIGSASVQPLAAAMTAWMPIEIYIFSLQDKSSRATLFSTSCFRRQAFNL